MKNKYFDGACRRTLQPRIVNFWIQAKVSFPIKYTFCFYCSICCLHSGKLITMYSSVLLIQDMLKPTKTEVWNVEYFRHLMVAACSADSLQVVLTCIWLPSKNSILTDTEYEPKFRADTFKIENWYKIARSSEKVKVSVQAYVMFKWTWVNFCKQWCQICLSFYVLEASTVHNFVQTCFVSSLRDLFKKKTILCLVVLFNKGKYRSFFFVLVRVTVDPEVILGTLGIITHTVTRIKNSAPEIHFQWELVTWVTATSDKVEKSSTLCK